MGINMRIFHCYGIKVKSLDSIPNDKKEEYKNNFCDMSLDELDYSPCIFDDCYAGEWEFFGQIINTSHDYRYDGWDSFEWEISFEDENKKIDELCENFGLDKPKHYVITYFS